MEDETPDDPWVILTHMAGLVPELWRAPTYAEIIQQSVSNEDVPDKVFLTPYS